MFDKRNLFNLFVQTDLDAALVPVDSSSVCVFGPREETATRAVNGSEKQSGADTFDALA